ncbi:ZNF713 isoform 5 [Pan troglodytes]|uniref:ZNF713 isoform 5 n=1 Tax=Pan troglodytes TaxID=9598 RepID=A0A2J8JU52_PANTR|nr:ZNF713 isoform 5 [Pan troglodytes]
MPSQNAVFSQEGNMEEKEMNDGSQMVRSQMWRSVCSPLDLGKAVTGGCKAL